MNNTPAGTAHAEDRLNTLLFEQWKAQWLMCTVHIWTPYPTVSEAEWKCEEFDETRKEVPTWPM
jgi:hypothetical protein